MSAPVELRCTTKQAVFFYIRAARNFMLGVRPRGDKEGRDPVDELLVTGMGNAINAAVAVAGRLSNDGVAKITMAETDYPDMDVRIRGEDTTRGVPLVRIRLVITDQGKVARTKLQEEAQNAD